MVVKIPTKMLFKSEMYRKILAITISSNDLHEEFTFLTTETLRSSTPKT